MSDDGAASGPYYALDFPGLSRNDAERILEWARQQGPALGSLLSREDVGPGSVVDPEFSYARYMDKCTVRSLKNASEIALATGHLNDSEVSVLKSIIEDFKEWLEQAAAGDDDRANE